MIKYQIQEKVNEKRDIGIKWREPSTHLFNTEAEAREHEDRYNKERQEYLDTLTKEQRSSWVEMVDYKILETEVENSIIVEGVVGDNEEDWDDYCTLVDDKNINGIIERYYKGNKIKVTIEVIK